MKLPKAKCEDGKVVAIRAELEGSKVVCCGGNVIVFGYSPDPLGDDCHCQKFESFEPDEDGCTYSYKVKTTEITEEWDISEDYSPAPDAKDEGAWKGSAKSTITNFWLRGEDGDCPLHSIISSSGSASGWSKQDSQSSDLTMEWTCNYNQNTVEGTESGSNVYREEGTLFDAPWEWEETTMEMCTGDRWFGGPAWDLETNVQTTETTRITTVTATPSEVSEGVSGSYTSVTVETLSDETDVMIKALTCDETPCTEGDEENPCTYFCCTRPEGSRPGIKLESHDEEGNRLCCMRPGVLLSTIDCVSKEEDCAERRKIEMQGYAGFAMWGLTPGQDYKLQITVRSWQLDDECKTIGNRDPEDSVYYIDFTATAWGEVMGDCDWCYTKYFVCLIEDKAAAEEASEEEVRDVHCSEGWFTIPKQRGRYNWVAGAKVEAS